MKPYWLICTFLFACFSSSGQVNRADSLYGLGHFEEASLYYEWAAFQDVDNDSLTYFLSQKANCYKWQMEYKKAEDILIRLEREVGTSQMVAQERILLAFLAGNAQDAKQQLLKYQLKGFPKDSAIVVYEVLVLAALEEWEAAKNMIMANSALLGLSADEAALIVPERIKWKNPEKAFNLSFFLPGVGQMYAGYPVRGLFSGCIQAALVGFSAYSIYQGYFFTGAMTGVALFYTFYFGGARYASRLAEQHNQQITKEIQVNFLETHKNKKALD